MLDVSGPCDATPLPERRVADGPPRLRRLALRLDDLGDQCDGVGIQAGDVLTAERLSPEQECLAEPEVIDAPGIGSAEYPPKVGRVTTRHGAQAQTEGGLDGVGQRRELAHVPSIR